MLEGPLGTSKVPCPKCGGPMNIVAYLATPQTVARECRLCHYSETGPEPQVCVFGDAPEAPPQGTGEP